MSTSKRTKRESVWSLWPRTRKPPQTTDDIPPLPAHSPINTDTFPLLIRHATFPTSTAPSDPLEYRPSSSTSTAAHVRMTESETITFSQTGVQPPVYVVTSLSDPPWEPLEMHVEDAQTASANLIFTRRFDNVAEGDHQYKIRIGDGHWVVDESKDSGTPKSRRNPTTR